MSFARPELLLLAIVGPVCALLAVLAFARRRRRVAQMLADSALLERLGGAELVRFPRLRLLLLMAAAAALGLAAAGPRWGVRQVQGRSTARSVVLALDVSKSMLATDVKPSRLERERLFVRRLMREMPSDRLGLVVFAGRAYVLSPLTVDQSALSLYIDALDPGIVSQGGSSLASAIMQATDLARGPTETAGERAVVLVTDGEALEDENTVRQAADRAARAGVTLFTVGVGTRMGSTVPELDATGRDIGMKRDEAGNVVVSRLNPDLLTDVARRAGGRYFDLEDASATSRLIGALGSVSASQTSGGKRLEPREQQAWFIAAALLLLLLDTLLDARGTARVHLGGIGRAGQVAALLAVLLVTSAAGFGDLERGNRFYRAGKFKEAVEAYQAALRGGTDSPELRYNLGTALLQLGQYAEAEQQFRAALNAVDPELRERTFYNLGNRFLGASRAEPGPDKQGPLLKGAIEAYERALRIDPQDVEAKWNLEMALRDERQRQQQQQSQGGGGQQPQNPQPQGGGGSGSGQSSPSQSPAQPQPSDGSSRLPLTKEQADRVLSAVEQDERDLTREKLRKGQRRTPVRRDW